MVTIGEFSPDRVRGHRNGRGLTREQVAAHIGLTVAAIRTYEQGLCQPKARALALLAELFGVPIGDLYVRHDDPFEDYVDAVVSHMPPLTDGEIKAAAAVLRRIDRRRHQPVPTAS